MKIKIYRNHNKFDTFSIENAQNKTTLQLLKLIKKELDSTLSFRHSCGSGICGGCAVRVNGTPVLSCTHKADADEILIEPLESINIIKDLVVDESIFKMKNKNAINFLKQTDMPIRTTPEDMKKYQLQATCIECASCYSICPVTKTNPEFLGPFVLTKTWRYISDIKETDEKNKIDAIQKNGVWDCILCGDCILVCPQGINSKMDISFLQMKSTSYGYINPEVNSFSFNFH